MCGAWRASAGIGTADERRHHHDFEAELGDVFEFFDSLGRGVHRDARGRRHAIGKFAENIGVIIVEAAADRAAQFFVADMRGEKALAGIQNRIVEAHLVEALVQQLRQRGGGAVVGIAGRIRPPYRTRRALIAALGGRQMIPAKIEGGIEGGLVTFKDRVAACVLM